MELAELATMVFVASGITYNAVKCWRQAREIRLGKEYPVTLALPAGELPEGCRTAVVMMFDHRGNLLRKYPETAVATGRTQCRMKCNAPEGVLHFCVLFSPHPLCLSGVTRREDVDRLLKTVRDVLVAETEAQTVCRSATFVLTPVVNCPDGPEREKEEVALLATCLPPEVNTDAMAKELNVDLAHCSEEWEPGRVSYTVGDGEEWLTVWRDGGKLMMQLRTNFGKAEREAQVELRTAERRHVLRVRQQEMGECAALTVSRRLFVTPGLKNEMVSLTVTPDNESVQWKLKGGVASDGGCWWSVSAPARVPLTGTHTLDIHLEAKPANVRSRSLLLTLETGTYPFNRTMEVQVTQGVCFDYYIEYPLKDRCARHSEVIETPLDGWVPGERRCYTICVNSNQAWHIVRDEKADWVEVSEPEQVPGLFGGRFVVTVLSNAGHRMKNGFPAARHTVISLVNETGVVKDILVYQGGYVRINGICWLDRNLEAEGKPVEVAIPLGLPAGSMKTYGGYFQFGAPASVWQSASIVSEEDWYNGTEENPAGKKACDPSPEGWRIPSRLEAETLVSRQPAVVEPPKGETPTHICLQSDDGVPVYLPLCGHLSHINGCRIEIPRGNRYWCGTSQSAIYGYSLCVETNRQMHLTHDMKKYGFPVRCVLDAHQ